MFAFDAESLMRMGAEEESKALQPESAQGKPAGEMEPELQRLKDLMGWK
ncbi:MAG: hypothetical protein MRY32_10055 [Rickettsiales bacterium]|nr:hypothetical protein [Rickettsiales bacterium]